MSKRLSLFEQTAFRFFGVFPNSARSLILTPINSIRFSKIKSLKTPTQLMLYVTNRCNARCRHCFYWKNLNTGSDLTLEQIEKLAYSLKHPLHLLALTGGEPFLRKDINEICNIFYRINKTKRINIPTNGLQTNSIFEAVKTILEDKFTRRLTIQFSLDSLKEDHDRMREVKGAFEKICSTIDKLKLLKARYNNFDLCVSTTISRHNYKEIDEIREYVQRKFDVFHKFSLVRDSSNVYSINSEILNDFNPPDKSYILPPLQEIEKIYSKLPNKDIESKVEALKIRYSIDMIWKRKKMVKNCLAGVADAAVFSSGDVTFCEATKPFGNLRDTDFDLYKLWNSKEANRRREQIKNCFCIQTCNLYHAMKYDAKTLLRLFSNIQGTNLS